MKQSTIDKVVVAFELLEEHQPDISTEHLLSKVAIVTGLHYNTVIEALRKSKLNTKNA